MSRKAHSRSGASKERDRRRLAAQRSKVRIPSSEGPASDAARGVVTEDAPASPPESGRRSPPPSTPFQSLAVGVDSRLLFAHEVRSRSGAPPRAGTKRGSKIVLLVQAGRR